MERRDDLKNTLSYDETHLFDVMDLMILIFIDVDAYKPNLHQARVSGQLRFCGISPYPAATKTTTFISILPHGTVPFSVECLFLLIISLYEMIL